MARIVHIEDDPANRLLVRKLLARAGHEVLEAADGVAGIRLACSAQPDLVLVDLNIPGLDGFEVTLRLRAEHALKGVPIVAITAEGDRDTSLAVGCSGFLQKPIAAKSFAATIQAYLQGQREPKPPQGDTRLREQSQRIVARLEKKVTQLMQANDRLRDGEVARTAFYRNISHELATPMTPVVGYVRLLLDEELGPLEPAQSKALGAVEDCVARLRRIIDNLLDVTGLEIGKMRFARKHYDFRSTIERALGSFAERWNRHDLSLAVDVSEDDFAAIGDDDRLFRATCQLLDNAIKFTPEGGRIGIALRRLEGGHFEVSVADSGPGVAAEAQGRIFEAFYQEDGSPTRLHGGTGVGLAIARRTARGLGGELRLRSPCDERIGGLHFEGSVFILTVAVDAPTEHSSVAR